MTKGLIFCTHCGSAGPLWNASAAELPDHPNCPHCGRPAVVVQPSPDRLTQQLISVIREADLTAQDLDAIQAAITDVGEEATLDDLADRVPESRAFLERVAGLGIGNWIALLAIIVAAVWGYIAHTDAIDAMTSADQPRAVQRTSQLSQKNLREIAHQVEVDLEHAPQLKHKNQSEH